MGRTRGAPAPDLATRWSLEGNSKRRPAIDSLMKQSPLLSFKSSAFAVTPGEDEATNPGISGKWLAQWIHDGLSGSGIDVGSVISEDFGWCAALHFNARRAEFPEGGSERCPASRSRADEIRVTDRRRHLPMSSSCCARRWHPCVGRLVQRDRGCLGRPCPANTWRAWPTSTS